MTKNSGNLSALPKYEFILECGVTKPTAMMHLSDKATVISAVCLHYSVLGSLAELEQLRRGLQTTRFFALMQNNVSLMKPLFIYQNKIITSDFIQDFFEVVYSEKGSNNRMKEEALMINWITYLQLLEGLSVHLASYFSYIDFY